jgi:hypothetical protein
MRVPGKLTQIWKLADELSRSFTKDERSGRSFEVLRSCVRETASVAERHQRALAGPLPDAPTGEQQMIDFTPPKLIEDGDTPKPRPKPRPPARPHKTVLPHEHFHAFNPVAFEKAKRVGVPRFSSSGLGIGDVLFAVPAIKALGGGELSITCFDTFFSWSPSHPFTSASYRGRTYHNLAKFLASQDYITECKAVSYDPSVYYDVEFDNVRHIWHRVVNENIPLLDLYQSYVGGRLRLDDAWLTPPDEVYPEFQDAVVINMNDRRVCELDLRVLGDYEHVVFLGLPREWEFFQNEWGISATHHEAKDFFDMASLMNSCRMFIGCSSSPIVLADGLNVDRIYCQWVSKPHHQSVGGNTVTVSTDEQFVDALLDRGIL